eukprot:TRINITY_DN10830_c0_g1_i3.p1 TRINITY_DN10830_c0_g1~~TRINITY_DN10830_c0_g1_i3.p1  ORF type:complete len:319 (+),score=27.35 TRINITY_DN10830_c0_g1_i3:105-1061(+)
MKDFLKGFADIHPDIACLQEVFSPFQKGSLTASLPDYHIISANCHPSPSLLGYIFTFVFLSILGITFFLSSSYFWLFLVLSLVFLPTNILSIFTFLTRNVFIPSGKISPDDDQFDFMGNTVLIKKNRWSYVEKVASFPFPHDIRGYPRPISFHPQDWFLWWFSMTFLRPGFMVLRCVQQTPLKNETTLIIVNCHLVVGYSNSIRRKQIRSMLDYVKKTTIQFQCFNVLICGDFNAHRNQPELELLSEYGYVDAVKSILGHRAEKFYTWDGRNPFVRVDPDQCLDYIWFGGEIVCKSCWRIFDKPPLVSDHYGVLANLL